MTSRQTSYLLIAAVVGGGAFAMFHSSAGPTDSSGEASPGPVTSAPTAEPRQGALPPNHPPIGDKGPSQASPPQGTDNEGAALHWNAPPAWQTLPNPSAMRLATYRVPPAAGDSEGAEMSVSRAGGSKEANIQRWIGQFDDAGKDTRETKSFRGLQVTIVTVSGTYLGGGMMPGTAAASHPKWALLAAIVEGPGTPYFFKITGPLATVKAARPAFDAMIDSLTPP
jgi:hypothetical protein